jgi:hypothetical protein
MRPLLFALAVAASPGVAQTFGLPGESTEPLPDMSGEEVIEGGITVESLDIQSGPAAIAPRAAPGMRVREAPGAVLRGLDKVSGEVTDLELSIGESARYGRLTVELDDCRVPVENPTGDAFAHLVIRAEGMQDAAFDGWMIASSPALSALDHPRYDVWVIRCRMS